MKCSAASQIAILLWVFFLVSSAHRLPQVAKAVSHSLNNCVNCLPGQKDVDMALKSIGEASKKLLIETVSLRATPGGVQEIESGIYVFLSLLFFT